MGKIGKFWTTQAADRSVSVPVTLCDLEWLEARGPIFPADVRMYTGTVCPKTTKSGIVTRGGAFL